MVIDIGSIHLLQDDQNARKVFHQPGSPRIQDQHMNIRHQFRNLEDYDLDFQIQIWGKHR